MRLAASVLVGLIALVHVWFLVLEMFLWNTEFGRKRFKLAPQEATLTAPLAANQGLYNGFLAAGLVWSFFLPPPLAFPVRVFFLGCVLVAGIYGGLTTLRPILYVQALPAVVALGLLLMTR